MPGGHKDPFDLLSAVNLFCQIRTRLFPSFDHSCHPSVSFCQNLLVCSNDPASDCMWCKSTPKHETADHVDQLMSYSWLKKEALRQSQLKNYCWSLSGIFNFWYCLSADHQLKYLLCNLFSFHGINIVVSLGSDVTYSGQGQPTLTLLQGRKVTRPACLSLHCLHCNKVSLPARDPNTIYQIVLCFMQLFIHIHWIIGLNPYWWMVSHLAYQNYLLLTHCWCVLLLSTYMCR